MNPFFPGVCPVKLERYAALKARRRNGERIPLEDFKFMRAMDRALAGRSGNRLPPKDNVLRTDTK